MAPSSRDRISVDLHGLKAVLFEQARDRRVTPSDLVRGLLTEALSRWSASAVQPASVPTQTDRVRLSLRMTAEQARSTLAAARSAGLPAGAFIAGLVAGVPVLAGGTRRAEHVAALVESSAELATLGRNIGHLSGLIRQGSSRAAQEYREMLDTLNADVRGHLVLASAVLADLRPRNPCRPAATSSST